MYILLLLPHMYMCGSKLVYTYIYIYSATAAAADPVKRAKNYFLAIFYNFRIFFENLVKINFWGSPGVPGGPWVPWEPWGALRYTRGIDLELDSSILKDFYDGLFMTFKLDLITGLYHQYTDLEAEKLVYKLSTLVLD